MSAQIAAFHPPKEPLCNRRLSRALLRAALLVASAGVTPSYAQSDPDPSLRCSFIVPGSTVHAHSADVVLTVWTPDDNSAAVTCDALARQGYMTWVTFAYGPDMGPPPIDPHAQSYKQLCQVDYDDGRTVGIFASLFVYADPKYMLDRTRTPASDYCPAEGRFTTYTVTYA